MQQIISIPKLKQLAPPAIVLAAALLLAFEPVLWLIQTWRDPSYASKGFYVFAACAGLFIWSFASLRCSGCGKPTDRRLALALLAATAAIRLAGQVLAVNTIGAIALVIDVYALGLLGGLQYRQRALSPAWLAIAFAFCLPLERIVQRTIGYALQHISADGACLVLGGVFDNVVCHGIRIIIKGKDVLVDLPCSGARTILLLLLFFSISAALARPTLRQAACGALGALAAAVIANVVRITVLAVGIAMPELVLGIDVMGRPWHDLLGLAVLAIGCAPVIAWTRLVYRPSGGTPNSLAHDRSRIPDRIRHDGWWLAERRPRRALPLLAALGFLGLAAVIVSLPRQPIDVARRDIAIDLPARLAGLKARAMPLSAKEKAYFVKFGGAAAKASYGEQALLVVRTSAPLRHLHAPDECLRGLGLDVQYLGARFAGVPTAIYRATTQRGETYRIDVSFVSDRGEVTTNVAHAVWLWLQRPGSVWTAVQRISPWHLDDSARASFERAVASHFKLPGDFPAEPPTTQSATLQGATQ